MYRILFTVTMLLPALFWAACGSEPSSSDILSKPPFAAVTDSIRRFPDKPELYLQRGLLLSQASRHELATPDYKKAWELAQEEYTALEYASNLILIGKTDESIEFLKNCVRQFPESREIKRRLSEVYAQSGRRKEALAQYEQILSSDSSNFMAWYEKGVLLSKMRDTAEALLSLEKAYALQPINYIGLAIANIYSNQKNPKVLAICDDILRTDSTGEMIDALLLKGIYYSDNRQYTQALQYFDECIRRDWKFTDAHIEKGIVWFEQRDYNKALESFKMASTVSNTNADTYYWTARCFEELKDKQQAVENYERALSLDPSITEAEDRLNRLK